MRVILAAGLADKVTGCSPYIESLIHLCIRATKRTDCTMMPDEADQLTGVPVYWEPEALAGRGRCIITATVRSSAHDIARPAATFSSARGFNPSKTRRAPQRRISLVSSATTANVIERNRNGSSGRQQQPAKAAAGSCAFVLMRLSARDATPGHRAIGTSPCMAQPVARPFPFHDDSCCLGLYTP